MKKIFFLSVLDHAKSRLHVTLPVIYAQCISGGV